MGAPGRSRVARPRPAGRWSIATGTASGKSLAYQLPVLSTLLTDGRATALYLSPTKALAADQLRSAPLAGAAEACAPRPSTATPSRPSGTGSGAHSRFVLTNPDMLHRGILPSHARWAPFLRRLRYVVVDECHTYRGVFGSHVAHVLRRLRRICALVRRLADLRAGLGDGRRPGDVRRPAHRPAGGGGHRGRLAPRRDGVRAVGAAADRGARRARSARCGASAGAEAARLLADLVVEDARTLAFVRSRRGAEVVALTRPAAPGGGRARARPTGSPRTGPATCRRSGARWRRRWRTATLLGVAATNALELGVDMAGLDAVVLAGFPGTLASLWQQAGRAGRAGLGALAVFVARDDPLDTYLVHHPEALFGRPVEATVLDPANPYVLGPQLCCAAAELALTEADLPLFGGAAARGCAAGSRPARPAAAPARPAGTGRRGGRPDVDIRGTGGEPVRVVEASTGRLLGTVDAWASHSTVHQGAVYLHQGVSYVVDELDLTDVGARWCTREEPDWSTAARDITDIRIVSTLRERDLGELTLHLGTVDVTNQVVSYLRRRHRRGEVLDETPLDLPARELRTRAVWYTLSDAALARAGLAPADVPGAAHAAEHAAIGLLPLFATCDRWDIGGVSTALHPDTGR